MAIELIPNDLKKKYPNLAKFARLTATYNVGEQANKDRKLIRSEALKELYLYRESLPKKKQGEIEEFKADIEARKDVIIRIGTQNVKDSGGDLLDISKSEILTFMERTLSDYQDQEKRLKNMIANLKKEIAAETEICKAADDAELTEIIKNDRLLVGSTN